MPNRTVFVCQQPNCLTLKKTLFMTPSCDLHPGFMVDINDWERRVRMNASAELNRQRRIGYTP